MLATVAWFLDATEVWPTHSRPLAREALRAAQREGWLFRPAEGHTFGTLKCGEGGDRCRVVIYSTAGPADGSDTAKHIKQAIRRCKHGIADQGDEAADALSEVEREASVLRLIDAASGLRDRQVGEEVLLQAIENDDDAGLQEGERLSREGDNRALVAFGTLGRPVAPWPPVVAVAELIAEAAALLDAAPDGEPFDDLRLLVQRLLDQ